MASFFDKLKPKKKNPAEMRGQGARPKSVSDGPKLRASAIPKASWGGLQGKGSKFILFVGDDGAILVFMQGSKLVRRLFAPSAEKEHIDSFIEILTSHPKSPIYLMVDLMDQSYVRHTLPPVSPLSVNKLVQRRLDRDFAPEDIKGSLSLGREKSGRKEWNFLLISLANNMQLQQWLELVLELENRFKGIYLVPVEAQYFIAELNQMAGVESESGPSAWQLLVSHDKVSGFRQVVLKDNQLVFTRLTQAMADGSAEVMAGNVEQEVLNTMEYLKRLGYNENAGIDINILLAQEIKHSVDVNKFNARHVKLYTPFEVSELLKLEQAALSADRFADVVLATAFGRMRKHGLKLNPIYAKKLDLLYHGRLAMRAVAAMLIVGLLVTIVTDFFAVNSTKSEIGNLTAERRTTREELVATRQDLESLDDNTERVMAVSALYGIVKHDVHNPLTFIREIAPLLGEKIYVRSLDWGLQEDAVIRSASASSGRRSRAPVAAQKADKPDPQFSVTMEMEFTGHGGDRTRLVRDANVFLERLELVFDRFDIVHEKLPGTISENEDIRVNFDDPTGQVDTLKQGEDIIRVTITGPKPGEDGKVASSR